MPWYVTGENQDKPGVIRLNSLVYAPDGGRIERAAEDGRDTGIFLQQHHGLALAGRSMEILPGARSSVTYVIITGKSEHGRIVVRTTPGPRSTPVILTEDRNR